jgi:hypothetical protein
LFGNRIKIDKDLLERARLVAKTAGYSSVEEFVVHVLEKELASFEQGDSEEEMRKKLQGLGYIS